MTEMAPGWYPDPKGENQQRYWDGDRWAEYYQPLAPEREEPRGAETAVQDYPYLAEGSATTSEPGPIAGGWTTHTPTTAWGTPAPPGAYLPSQNAASGEQWEAGDPTQEFGAGPAKGRGGLIAIIVICVVVLGLLIAGGIMAYELNGLHAGQLPAVRGPGAQVFSGALR